MMIRRSFLAHGNSWFHFHCKLLTNYFIRRRGMGFYASLWQRWSAFFCCCWFFRLPQIPMTTIYFWWSPNHHLRRHKFSGASALARDANFRDCKCHRKVFVDFFLVSLHPSDSLKCLPVSDQTKHSSAPMLLFNFLQQTFLNSSFWSEIPWILKYWDFTAIVS